MALRPQTGVRGWTGAPMQGQSTDNFARQPEGNLVRELCGVVPGLLAGDQDAVSSGENSQVLEFLRGGLEAVVQRPPARDVNVNGTEEGGHGVSFLVAGAVWYM